MDSTYLLATKEAKMGEKLYWLIKAMLACL